MTMNPFSRLDPDTILTCVERALDRRLRNVCRPHASYINRVYELQDEQGDFIIAKFYRPRRWTEQAIHEELHFVLECAEAELPVIAPLPVHGGRYLGDCNGIKFALYPRCGGRVVDEYHTEHWQQIGRLLGRVHQVGKFSAAPARERMHPRFTTRKQADYLLDQRLLPAEVEPLFRDVVNELIELLEPRFNHVEYHRIHGDCHAANIIFRPGESFFLIDFDDMVVGPAIQDMWMLLPGPVEESRHEMNLLLEGYETFCAFDDRTVQLIEPLRAMRYIHYMSWCARQFVEDGSTRVDESFGSASYWQRELAELRDQVAVIRGS